MSENENPGDDSDRWTWHSWQVILLMLNAVTGVILLEWAWYKNYRFRKPIKELETVLPEFHRADALKWARWKFYPGAMTIMIPRFLFSVVFGTLACILIWLVLLGHPMDAQITGCRRRSLRVIYKVWAFFLNGVLMLTTSYTKELTVEDVDYYQEWLGPIQQQEKERAAPDQNDILQVNALNHS